MYKRKPVSRLSGAEKFINTSKKDFTVLDFWKYGFSNLNSNVLRGALAEYIVEAALKDVKDIEIRNPWGDYDVDYKGTTIEVKSCSYLQDWHQNKLTSIKWSGLKATKLFWNNAVGKKEKGPKEYKAQVYVLALLDHKETETLDIRNLDQWRFFVLTRNQLRKISNNSASISLSRLKKNEIESVVFSELKNTLMV